MKTTHVTPDEVSRIRTAFHEAGHCVIATVLGCPIHGAFADGSGGRTEYEHLPDLVAGPITFSGPYAQAYWAAGGRPYPAQVTAALAANSRDAAELHDMGRDARMVAEAVVTPLVARTWPAIARTAAMLFRSGEVNHADVCGALGVGVSDNQLALAAIRRVVPSWFMVEHRLAMARIGHLHAVH